MKKGTYRSIIVASVAMLTIGSAAAAIVSTGGMSVETSGMKISLDLKSKAGAKVIFQRAD